MKKILIAILVLAVAVYLVINVFGAKLLAGVLEQQIGAPVSISRLSVGTSELGIYGMKIGNPEGFGFEEETLAEIPEISARYDLGSFFKGKPHFSLIVLNFGDVTVEKTGNNTINLLEVGAVKGMTKDMMEGEEKPQPAPSEPSEPSKPAKPMELQIDEVRVNIGKARYVDSAKEPSAVKEIDLGIHDEVFRNVTEPANLTKGIIFLVMRKVGLNTLTENLGVLTQGVGGGLKSALDDVKGKFNL